MSMQNLTLNDIDRYLGMRCYLKVGLFDDDDYGFFCDTENDIIFETRNLTMTYDPVSNEQVLDFGNNNTIRVKQIRSTDIDISVNGNNYALSRRVL